MNPIQWPNEIGKQEREDALAAYRQRVTRSLAIVASIFLVPFAIHNFIKGYYWLGLGALSAFLVLAVNSVAAYLDRKPPIPLGVLLIPALGGMTFTLQHHEFYGALWAYPAVLLFHFGMTRFKANIYSSVMLIATSTLMVHYIGLDYALRFFATLTLTIILINIALNIIDDLHNRLIEQTILDPMTGAFNRRHMDSCIEYAIERNRRLGATVSLLLIDIDRFKSINDEFGHAAGDHVLKSLVQVVRNRARKLDMLFRIGGEEFLLLLPDTRQHDAAVVAEDIRAAVVGANMLPDWQVSVSIGVAELHAGESADAWLKHADDAMYVAKNTGRDRVVLRTA